MKLSLYHWSGVVLDCIDPDICLLFYFELKVTVSPVEFNCLLQYSVVCTVESISLFYILFIS